MLLADAKTAHESLQGATAAYENLAEAQALLDLHGSLGDCAKRLHELVLRADLLSGYGVSLSPGPDIKAIRKTIINLRTRFDQVSTSRTLTQGKHWNGLLAALDGANVALDASQRQDWKNYFATQLFAGLPPAQRRVGLVHTLPENKLAIDQYTRLYEQFIRYKSIVPSTLETLEDVHRCSDALRKISFVEDVPKDVETFINAVPTGASLELLTSEVIDWLRENGLLGSYMVRARA
jgi:hypothetical protein